MFVASFGQDAVMSKTGSRFREIVPQGQSRFSGGSAMEFLRDPIWQFLSVIGAVAGLALTILLFKMQRNQKKISDEVISSRAVVNVSDEVKGRIQVLFDGMPVKDVSLVILKICNTGNIPILSTEYDRPITFNFGNGSKILDVEILDMMPSNIKASTKIDIEKIMVEPLLLNSKDSFKLKVLLINFSGEIRADARIVRVKQILSHQPLLTSILNIS